MAENWKCRESSVVNHLYTSVKLDHRHNLYIRCSLLYKECLHTLYIHKWVYTHRPLIPCTVARYMAGNSSLKMKSVAFSETLACKPITMQYHHPKTQLQQYSKLHNFEVRHHIVLSNNYYVNEQSTQLSCNSI